MWLIIMSLLSIDLKLEKEISLEDLDFYNESPRQIVVADNGRMLLIDSSETKLILLEPDGRLVSVTGRKGQGPGELQYPWRLHSSNNQFHVYDWRLHKILILDHTGKLVREDIGLGAFRSPFLSNNKLFFLKREWKDRPVFHVEAFNRKEKTETRLFSSEMEPIGTAEIWTAMLTYTPFKDMLAVNHGDFPVINLVAMETGKNIRKIELKIPRIPLSDQFIDDHIKSVSSGPKGRTRINKVHRPNYWPYIRHIFNDEDQRMWLFMHPPEKQGPSGYLVIDEKGKALGEGHVNGDAHALHNGKLYVIRTDEDETQSLMRFKIIR